MSTKTASLLDDGRMALAVAAVWVIVSALIFGLGPWSRLVSWGGGAFIFDVTTGYTPEGAVDSLTAFGDEGLRLYRTFIGLDFVYTVVQGVAIAWLVLFAARRGFGRVTRWRWLAAAPLVLSGADVLENLLVLHMIASYPAVGATVAAWASRITALKLALVPVLPATVLVAMGLILYGRRRGGGRV